MYRLLVAIACFAVWGLSPRTLAAQPDSTVIAPQASVQFDSTQVVPRQYDASQMASYRADPNFQYEEQVLPASWWERLMLWLRQLWHDLTEAANSGNALDYILVGIGAITLVYLVVKLLGMDDGGIFSAKSRRSPLHHAEVDENIHTLDFESELQQAVAQRNYRAAIRLLYLQCLKSLADRELIDWQPAKTNADYLRELQGGPHAPGFKALTYQYEYSWYGDFPVGHGHFDAVREVFEQFEQKVRA